MMQEENPEKYKAHFSQFIKAGLNAENLEATLKKVHAAIRKDPGVHKAPRKAPAEKKKWLQASGEGDGARAFTRVRGRWWAHTPCSRACVSALCWMRRARWLSGTWRQLGTLSFSLLLPLAAQAHVRAAQAGPQGEAGRPHLGLSGPGIGRVEASLDALRALRSSPTSPGCMRVVRGAWGGCGAAAAPIC